MTNRVNLMTGAALMAGLMLAAESVLAQDGRRPAGVERRHGVGLDLGPVSLGREGPRGFSAGLSGAGKYASVSTTMEVSAGIRGRAGAGVYGTGSLGVYGRPMTGEYGLKVEHGIGAGGGVDVKSAGLTRTTSTRVPTGNFYREAMERAVVPALPLLRR